jgi:hypothetical protein
MAGEIITKVGDDLAMFPALNTKLLDPKSKVRHRGAVIVADGLVAFLTHDDLVARL